MDACFGLLRFRRQDQPNGIVVGTGFLVRKSDNRLHAVSCAHVIAAALGLLIAAPMAAIGRQAGSGERPFLGSRRVSAEIIAWRAPLGPGETRSVPGHDVAVLRLDRNVPDLVVPALRSAPAEQVAPMDGSPPFNAFRFMSTGGSPVDGVLRRSDAGGRSVAAAKSEVGPFIEQGMSGGALLAGRLVIDTAVGRFDVPSRQALAIPSLAIADADPPLARTDGGPSAFSFAQAPRGLLIRDPACSAGSPITSSSDAGHGLRNATGAFGM